MSYAEDLLEQAEHLATRELKKPRQASLRRAVSAAYYALFHLLICDAAKRFSPQNPKGLQQHWQRAFGHAEMKSTCQAFASPKPPKSIAFLVATPLSADLITVAKAFVDLQEARHEADYDMAQTFLRQDASDQIERAGDAFAAWKKIRKTTNADVFLSALLLSKRWTK